MTRCCSLFPSARAMLLAMGAATLLAGLHAPAQAQISDLQPPPFEGTPNDHRQRNFTAKAERGWMEFVDRRMVTVDGKELQLGGGLRVFSERNMLIPVTRLLGERLEVMYTLDNMSRVNNIWLMKENEKAGLTPRQKREQALRMQGIDPTQIPRRDRSSRLVPFDELPKYKNSLP